MSFSSRSSNGNHYREENNGSNNYQKKSFLGNLFNIMGSGSRSKRNFNNQNHYNNNNLPINNQPIVNRNSMICNNCNAQIPTGSKFCLHFLSIKNAIQ